MLPFITDDFDRCEMLIDADELTSAKFQLKIKCNRQDKKEINRVLLAIGRMV